MKFEAYQDAAGEWRWRLKAKNGRVVADSAEGYKTRTRCIYAMWAIRDHSRDASIFMVDPGNPKKGTWM